MTSQNESLPGNREVGKIRPVPTSRREVADRLKLAVVAGGGNNVVARRSGVPVGTLNNYLAANHDLKLPALVALAAACGVDLVWLATGAGNMKPDQQSSDRRQPGSGHSASVEQSDDGQKSLLSVLDFKRLSKAVGLALEGFATHQIPPDAEILTRVAIAVYQTLENPAQPDDPKTLATILTAPWAEKERQRTIAWRKEHGLPVPEDGS